jgi:hypothetical protein
MRIQLTKITLVAGLMLAMAFTLSCSSNGSNNSNPTYYYSAYGIKDCSMLESLKGKYPESPSFQDVKDFWSEVRQLNCDFLESRNGITESDGRNELALHDLTPKEIDGFIERLNERGNNVIVFYSGDARYCRIVWYIERE